MKTYTAHLESVSPYSQSRHYSVDQVPELERETKAAYEKRTWRHRMHVDGKGQVFIPPMAFKNCLSEAAKFISMKVPGNGKATYTKHFEAGVMITDPVELGIAADDVAGEWLYLPSDGVRGSGKRVDKCYPVIPQWDGVLTIHVLDELITRDVLQRHLDDAGRFIGIGRFRPRNNGFYGRFRVTGLD